MKKNIFILIILIIIVSVIRVYINNSINIDNDIVSVLCFLNEEKEVNELEIGDEITCNILYQNSFNISTINYLLDYGSGLDIVNDDFVYQDNFYKVDLAHLNDDKVLNKITYRINDNANKTNLYVALRNINVFINKKKYLIEKDYIYDLRKYFK